MRPPGINDQEQKPIKIILGLKKKDSHCSADRSKLKKMASSRLPLAHHFHDVASFVRLQADACCKLEDLATLDPVGFQAWSDSFSNLEQIAQLKLTDKSQCLDDTYSQLTSDWADRASVADVVACLYLLLRTKFVGLGKVCDGKDFPVRVSDLKIG